MKVGQEVDVVPLIVLPFKVPRESVMTSVILVFRTFGLKARTFNSANEAKAILVLFDFFAVISRRTERINDDTSDDGGHDDAADNEKHQVVNGPIVEMCKVSVPEFTHR